MRDDVQQAAVYADLDFRKEEQDVGQRERLEGHQLIYNS